MARTLALYSKRELETSDQPRLADYPDRLAGVGIGLRDAVRFRRGHPRRRRTMALGSPATSKLLPPQVRSFAAHPVTTAVTMMLLRVAATTTATRADSVPGPSLLVAVPVHDSISNLTDSDAVFDYRTPPGSTPPTASPLVLRV